MDKVNVLIVENDNEINETIYNILSRKGYIVKRAFSGLEGILYIQNCQFDLVVFNLALNGTSGEEFIERIINKNNISKIAIEKEQNNLAYELLISRGIDDYLKEDFQIDELIDKVQYQLDEYKILLDKEKKRDILKYKRLLLDKSNWKVIVRGRVVQLTGKEFKILKLLMESPNKVFTKSYLFEEIWMKTYEGDDNTISVHISNIRNKIKRFDKENRYIRTVWGIGFKLYE